jgi:hypothetical protein
MTWRYTLMVVCLLGQAIISGCTTKDIAPSIDDLVGTYDCEMEWSSTGRGGSKWILQKFEISKSSIRDDILDIKIVIDENWTDTWQLKYFTYSNMPSTAFLTMDKQVVRQTKVMRANGTAYIYELQLGSGKAFGDSITFEGERFFEPVLFIDPNFYKYRAKKRR